jgi:hypothetical protein
MAPGIARCPQPNKLMKLTNKLNNHLLNIFPGQIKACPLGNVHPKADYIFYLPSESCGNSVRSTEKF